MLSNRQWLEIFWLLRRLETRRKGRGHPIFYSDALMAWLALWAAAHQWPITELAIQLERNGWPKLLRGVLPRRVRRRMPDVSTLSRRWRQEPFFDLLERLLMRLAAPDTSGFLDGTILPVGHHSRDPHAWFGGPGSHFQKGFRLLRVVNSHGQAWGVRVAPANESEVNMAADLIHHLGEGGVDLRRVVADKQFDSEPLHEQIAQELGAYLLAPRYPRGRNPKMGKRRRPYRGRYRRRAQRILRSAWGRHWSRRRRTVERSNGWLNQRPHNLYALPAFIRTLPRVRRWALSHETLQSFRKQCRLAQKTG